MYFKLVDGIPVWATYKKEGVYYFAGDTIPQDAEEIEQPPQTVVEKAEKLKGKTYSKTEFEKMLLNVTETERLEALESAMLEIVLGGLG